MTQIMFQNGFFFLHALECTEATRKRTYMQHNSSQNHHDAETQRGERRASILVLPHTGEIDGCIQDFYTPLIGFTGH